MNTERCVVCNSHQRFYTVRIGLKTRLKGVKSIRFEKSSFFTSHIRVGHIYSAPVRFFLQQIFLEHVSDPFWKHPVFRLRIHCSLASFCTVISVCGDLRGDDGDRDALETGIAFRARSSRTHGRREHEAETRGWGSTGDECDQSKRQRK